jgi:hypothetical protein
MTPSMGRPLLAMTFLKVLPSSYEYERLLENGNHNHHKRNCKGATAMIEQLTITHVGILVFVIMIGSELIKQGTQYFFKKLTKDDYLTKADCQSCSAKGSSTDIRDLEKKFDERMGEMRGILLVVALKANIPMEDLKPLLTSSG